MKTLFQMIEYYMPIIALLALVFIFSATAFAIIVQKSWEDIESTGDIKDYEEEKTDT